jgi:Zn-dependent peptidase ImmA (M78 family)
MAGARPPITDLDGAIAAAGELRRTLAVDPLTPLPCAVSLVESQLDVDVIVARLPAGCSGFYLPRNGRSLVAVNGTHAVVRQRFTLAHEIGHHVLAHGPAPRVLAAPAAGAVPATANDRERAANAFAAELLCPADGVREFVGSAGAAVDFDLVVRISAAYGISAAAVLARLETAEILTDAAIRSALQARVDAAEHVPRYGELGLTAIIDELEQVAQLGVLPRLPEGISGDVLLAVTDPDAGGGNLPTPIRKLRRLLGVDVAHTAPSA